MGMGNVRSIQQLKSNYLRMKLAIFRHLVLILCFTMSWINLESHQISKELVSKRYTILGLGDSITEGGEEFHSYLFPLWEKLFTAGYTFDFIGPRESNCRSGKLNHSGFSGKNAEYLDAHIDSIYRNYPANIVLLHTGHNHFETENPVPGIIAAQESIIQKIIAINPEAKILVAQVIPSGKMPKYSYLLNLNKRIPEMVHGLNLANVILVNQAKDFDWKKNTIEDKVHPNSEGAEKMAEVWFQAFQKVCEPQSQAFHPEIVTYKTLEVGDLKLHVFEPDHLKKGEKRPAIVYFFGGGWSLGTPLQFYRECAYYASKGMVAVSAEYRISYLHHSTPFESVEDAEDAIRWLRENANRLNIDPDRIAGAGASAGGHLAAATGTLPENSGGKQSESFKPNLMLLYYAVVDNSENGFGSEIIKMRYKEISPLHNIDSSTSPALFLLGTKDSLIPVKTAEEFQHKMKSFGVDCELHLIEGAGHPIFYYARELTDNFYTIRKISDKFLERNGYLNRTRN